MPLLLAAMDRLDVLLCCAFVAAGVGVALFCSNYLYHLSLLPTGDHRHGHHCGSHFHQNASDEVATKKGITAIHSLLPPVVPCILIGPHLATCPS